MVVRYVPYTRSFSGDNRVLQEKVDRVDDPNSPHWQGGDFEVGKEYMLTRPYTRHPVTWKENVPFMAEMTFSGDINGSTAWITDENGVGYNLFLSALGNMLRDGIITGNPARETWVVVKKNIAYGISPLYLTR